MKREKLHIATLVFGSILALAIAFSQYLTLQSAVAAKEVKTEQGDRPGSDRGAVVTLPSFSLPAPLHVEGNLDAHFLFEILQDEASDEHIVQPDIPFADRLFETLFRVIISPNAP